MIKTVRFSVVLLFFLLLSSSVLSQGSPGGPTCGEALAFCTAEANIPFDNCYNGSADGDCSSSGETGINYGCLFEQPFPTWYFLQIQETGDLEFQIIQNTSIDDDGTPTGTGLDVDFAIWGPFTDINACGDLGEPIDCSYSSAAIENAAILNAQVGEIYIFLITNFQQQQGEIFITQTNGTSGTGGSTDCSIVDAALGPDQNVCNGNTVTLDATEATAVNYNWAVDTGSGFIPIPDTDGMATIDVTTSGNYQVTITNSDGNTGIDEVLVTFFENPAPATPSDLVECDGMDNDGSAVFNLDNLRATILAGQSEATYNVTFHLSQSEASTGINALSGTGAYNSATDIIYVRVENSGFTDCFDDTIQFTITVEVLPRAVNPPVYQVCDDDNDGDDTNGVVEFDLSTRDAFILDGQDATQFIVSYHELIEEANGNINPLADTYTSGSRTLFARVENISFTDCFSVTEVVLQVNELPIVNTPVLLAQCDTDTDGFAPFNLTEAQPLLSSNASNETFVYTDAGGTTITDPTNYTNPNAVSSTVLVSVITANGCSRSGQIDLQVTASQIPPGTLYEYSACDTDSDGMAVFDFSDATGRFEALFPQGVTISYFETQQDAEAELNAITSIAAYNNNLAFTDAATGIQQIWVRVDGDTNNDCVGLGIHIELTTLENPTFPDTVAPLEVCSDDGNLSTFDLTIKDGEITVDNLVNYQATYYGSIEAYTSNTPIASPENFSNSSNPQTIYYSLENTTTGCITFHNTMNFQVIINQNPVVNTPSNLNVCDVLGTNDGITIIDLSVKDIEITGVDDPNLIVSYHLDEAGAIANDTSIVDKTMFANTENPQALEVRITDSTTSCFSLTSITIEVELAPEIFQAENLIQCADDLGVNSSPEQEIATFDITQQSATITGNVENIVVEYYTTLVDAQNSENEILEPSIYVNITNPQTIYARTFNTVSNCKSIDTIDFEIFVQPLPYVNLTDEGGAICVSEINGEVLNPFTINGSVENPQIGVTYTYEWTLDSDLISSEAVVTIAAVGNYQVLVTATYPDGSQCDYVAEAIYTAQSAPVFEAIVLENSFNTSGLYTVEVTVTNSADPESMYEFAIDDGSFQTDTTFTNVTPGGHTIFGRLANGACVTTAVEISIIDYPRFFTPNADGINDTWNIIGLGEDPNLTARIFIFDRTGKLLKQISPVGTGWDGNFNGQLMPSSDYWFRVEFTETDEFGTQRIVNGHFTLKR